MVLFKCNSTVSTRHKFLSIGKPSADQYFSAIIEVTNFNDFCALYFMNDLIGEILPKLFASVCLQAITIHTLSYLGRMSEKDLKAYCLSKMFMEITQVIISRDRMPLCYYFMFQIFIISSNATICSLSFGEYKPDI